MNIVIVFDEPGEMGYPFNTADYYDAYTELSENIGNLGHQTYFARGKDSVIGKNSFRGVWVSSHGSLVQIECIKADVVYDKSTFLNPDDHDMVVNSSYIKSLCNDKSITYERFKELMPTTKLVSDHEELVIELSKRSNSRMVVKPISGSQGNGVLIGYTHELVEVIPDNYITPCIVQEFVDSSVGIPGIVEALHDIRVVMMNSKPVACYIRIPAEGSYVANVSLGASHRVIDVKSIPNDVLRIVLVIDRDFSEHGSRLYSVDLCNSLNGYKLIEINSQPGMWSSLKNNSFKHYNKKMAQFLID